MGFFTKYVCFYKLDEKHTLLLNTLTSAVDLVDNGTLAEIYDIIQNNNVNRALYDKLKKRGYVFDSRAAEMHMLDSLRNITVEAISNQFVTYFKICPTMGCNLRCTYCYQEHAQHRNYSTLSNQQLDVIFKYIQKCDQLLKAHSNNKDNHVRIALIGGEPLLEINYNIVEKVLAFTKELGTKLYITTNGTTVDKYCKLLNKYRDTVVIQVTLDGNKFNHDKKRIYASGKGTFNEICDGIDKILRLGIKTSVRINVDKDNLDSMFELKDLFEKHAWLENPLFSTYATPIRCYEKNSPLNKALDDSRILDVFMTNGWFGKRDSFINRMDSSVYDMVFRLLNPDKMKKYVPWQISYCVASQGRQLVFLPNGNICTCLKCTDSEIYSVGKYDENGVEIDKDKLNIWKRRDPFNISKCRECKYILLCAGGCPYHALKKFGNINCGVCNDIEKTLEVYVKHIKNHLLNK